MAGAVAYSGRPHRRLGNPSNRGDQGVDLLQRVVEREGRTDRRLQPQPAQDRLRAVVPGAYRDALGVELPCRPPPGHARPARRTARWPSGGRCRPGARPGLRPVAAWRTPAARARTRRCARCRPARRTSTPRPGRRRRRCCRCRPRSMSGGDLIGRSFEGDVGDHVAAALPGGRLVQHLAPCRTAPRSRWARRSCARRRRRSPQPAAARRPAGAAPTGRRRRARARLPGGASSTICSTGVTVPRALETCGHRNELGARAEQLGEPVHEQVARVVHRCDLQRCAGAPGRSSATARCWRGAPGG